jgi:hypothetical protein
MMDFGLDNQMYGNHHWNIPTHYQMLSNPSRARLSFSSSSILFSFFILIALIDTFDERFISLDSVLYINRLFPAPPLIRV